MRNIQNFWYNLNKYEYYKCEGEKGVKTWKNLSCFESNGFRQAKEKERNEEKEGE